MSGPPSVWVVLGYVVAVLAVVLAARRSRRDWWPDSRNPDKHEDADFVDLRARWQQDDAILARWSS